MHVRDDDEQGHERGDAGHHEGDHDRAEQDVLADKLHLGQCVANHRAEHHVAQYGDDRDDEAVGEVRAKVQLGEPLREVS